MVRLDGIQDLREKATRAKAKGKVAKMVEKEKVMAKTEATITSHIILGITTTTLTNIKQNFLIGMTRITKMSSRTMKLTAGVG